MIFNVRIHRMNGEVHHFKNMVELQTFQRGKISMKAADTGLFTSVSYTESDLVVEEQIHQVGDEVLPQVPEDKYTAALAATR